jgi:CubicO group peptidase (beta-lactamase class C family)
MIRCLLPLLLLVYPTEGADRVSQIDAVVARYHQFGLFNGSVLVVDQGQVVFKKGYGIANMEWDIPNAPDTKFRLGSLTKQFTAAAAPLRDSAGGLGVSTAVNRVRVG